MHMDSVLIYDVQSEIASDNGEEPFKEFIYPKKQLKQTEMSQVPQTRIVKVQSPPSFALAQEHGSKEQQKVNENIIFYDEDLLKSVTSVDVDETNRGLLKLQKQDSDDDLSEEYDQVKELQEYQDDPQPNKRKSKQTRIIPQQTKLENRTVVVEADSELFVKQIVTQGYRISCVIDIQRNFLGMASKYHLFLRWPEQFLLSAKKESIKYYSSFLISKNPYNIHKRGNVCIGRLEANFLGTQFKLFNRKQQYQSLKLVISHQKNIIGLNGPRNFMAIKLNPNVQETYRQNLSTILQKNEKSKQIQLSTQRPTLRKGKYRLDFKGKIKIPSSKNFILSYKAGSDSVKRCLLFGKLSQNRYLLEVQSPLSVFEAFGICLSSLDSKLMVN